MNFTISSFVSEVRKILRDSAVGVSGETYYSDETIHFAVADAVRHLYAVRPDSRYSPEARLQDTEIPFTATELPNFEVNLDSKWHRGVVYYAAALCYENDIKDAVHKQLATELKQQADALFAV